MGTWRFAPLSDQWRIAEQLELTKPALYYYFKSREALLFELLFDEWLASAREVEAAVAATNDGADAVEALMRTFFVRYRGKLDLYRLAYMTAAKGLDLPNLIGPAELERVRPVNDMLFDGATERLRADQRASLFPRSKDPRRFAFTALTTVMGLLNMTALTAAGKDPLVHGHQDLIDDVVQTFRLAARGGKKR